MILGVVNGGLGLQLARGSQNTVIAYGVVAGVVGLVYILLALFRRKGGNRRRYGREGSLRRVTEDSRRRGDDGLGSAEMREENRRERERRERKSRDNERRGAGTESEVSELSSAEHNGRAPRTIYK